MAETILPSPEEAARYAVGPESVAWRRAGDARTMVGAGTALLLQVSHPTVAAGVREHSDFRTDPWGRLFRTLDYVNLLVYGGPRAAAETGARMRAMHQKIKGVAPDGTRYHALEPEAYAWVHATLAHTIVLVHSRFGRPMSAAMIEQFYAEWRGLGRFLGIRERDLPEGWGPFCDYVDEMVATRLQHNDVVDDVMATMAVPARPPVPGLGDRTWRMLGAPAARAQTLATVGLLPPLLRERCGMTWTRAQELELRALGAAMRSATPVMPRGLRMMGPGYLKWRKRQIADGMFGPALAA
jgi:uncharacterized protein (DUF2236 family)